MKVSVLLAVYNGEKYIEKSIDSVLRQTYTDFELLIGFNGTTDNSKEIVNRFNDSRIKIFDYKDDKGKAKTLNKLLLESKGEWLAIQDDDDIWFPEKLEKQMALCTTYDIIGTQIKYINEADEIIGGVDLALKGEDIKNRSLAGDNQVANTSAIVRKTCAESINGWRTDVDGIEDFDFWLRLMRKGYRFINIESIEVKHRLHTKSNFNTKKHDLSLILDPRDIKQKRKSLVKRLFGFLR